MLCKITLALTAHNAVGNIANTYSRQYRPSRKICDVF